MFLGMGIIKPSLYNGRSMIDAGIYHFIGLIYGSGSLDRTAEYGGALFFNTPIWYIPFSIILKLFVTLIYSVIKDTRKNNVLLFLVSSFAALLLYHITHINALFMECETVIYILPFFFAGRLLFSYSSDKSDSGFRLGPILAGLALMVVGSFIGFANGQPGYLSDGYGLAYILFLASALLLCVGTVGIVISLSSNKNKLLQMIGQNSLGILLLHKFPLEAFDMVFAKLKNVTGGGQLVYRT